jgi:DNA-binding Xre family transcriptional regulator
VKRQASYQWHLREVMAARGLFTTTDLVPRLAERGITLSVSQVHRLVTGIPERLSLPVLAALCDILQVSPDDLISVSAEPVSARKTAAARSSVARDLDPALRPVRARIRPEP